MIKPRRWKLNLYQMRNNIFILDVVVGPSLSNFTLCHIFFCPIIFHPHGIKYISVKIAIFLTPSDRKVDWERESLESSGHEGKIVISRSAIFFISFGSGVYRNGKFQDPNLWRRGGLENCWTKKRHEYFFSFYFAIFAKTIRN